MKVFFIFFMILLIFFIPIPIKFNIHYSTINYYIKLYGFSIISKKKANKAKSSVKKQSKFLSKLKDNLKFIKLKSLIPYLYNIKFKPLLKMKFTINYSLDDAAKTAILYGMLYQFPSPLYVLLNVPFKVNKFTFNINPIFEDKFLLKIETSSIIFLSIANIIYMIIILFRFIKKQGR